MLTPGDRRECTEILVRRSRQRVEYHGSGTNIVPRLIERDRNSARVALTTGYALLHSDDDVELIITVEEDCLLEIVEIGGTIAYPTPGSSSAWSARISLGRNARLLWNSLPFVVAHDATVTKRTSVTAHDSARALLREIIVMGRTGEIGGELTSIFDSRLEDGRPTIVEKTLITGARPVTTVMGANRVLDSLHLLGLHLAAEDTTPRTMVTELPGAVDRFIGVEAHRSDIPDTWRHWRALLVEGIDDPSQSLRPHILKTGVRG